MAERVGKTVGMFRSSLRCTLMTLCGLGLLAAYSSAQAPRTTAGVQHKVHKAKPKPAPVVEPVPVVVLPPPPPPPPPTPGEMPPNPPQVSYVDGQLTIVAENSMLSDILRAVGQATGATLDVPPVGGSERVWIQLGPAPARSVLASLLSGTDLDYVIQAADDDPNRLQSVLLTARTNGNGTAVASSSPGGSQTFAGRIASRIRAHGPGIVDLNTPDPDGSDPSSVPDSSPVAQSPDPTPAADTTAAAADPTAPTSPDTSSNPLSAKIPLAVSEAQAHPTPIPDTQQGVPQLLNLFELRRQIQEQQNTQQKTAAASGSH